VKFFRKALDARFLKEYRLERRTNQRGMIMRTYWQRFSRDFANEYSIGIATTQGHADQYQAEGYDRISRCVALREMSDRGDNATQVYCSVTIDGSEVEDRFSVARIIRVA
jgi:hypothetical protein